MILMKNDQLKTAALAGNLRPEWLRITAAVTFTGVSRSRLYEWIAGGRIRSACIREKHQKKGTRLIHTESLTSFLDSMASGGEQQ